MRSYDEARSDSSTIYVGIDVHKKSWHVTIRSVERQEWSGSIASDWEVLEKVLGRYSDRKVVAVYEAGFSGFWLYRCTPPKRSARWVLGSNRQTRRAIPASSPRAATARSFRTDHETHPLGGLPGTGRGNRAPTRLPANMRDSS
jgi:hypothetical protein